MSTKFLFTLIFLLSTFLVIAQKEYLYGNLSPSEKSFTQYSQDTTANAVVLYEKGNNHFKTIEYRTYLVKEYHVKIKILNEKGFNEANISIPYYNEEEVNKIEAVTHNGNDQSHVSNTAIFTENINQGVSIKRFTFPNIKKGSIIEYRYQLTTPYLFKLDGWKFQSNIPKLYSEFKAEIPANIRYNRELIGNLKLDTNEATVIEKLGLTDREAIKYIMKNIPAFKIDENYMLAPSNYISRLDFELASYHAGGSLYNYTESWESVDEKFMKNRDIGKQLIKKNFFEKNVPQRLLSEGEPLTRATNIYRFVQEHFVWNGYYSSYGKAEVKKAFKAKKGNAWEINMSLINLLNAAGIKTNLMLTSTRPNGLPKKSHPVMTDFNYAIAKAEINGKNYLLDATDKYMPFGMLPFKALNHYGRVMDFKEASYWHDIKPWADNKQEVRASMKFNIEEHKAEGVFDVISKGYKAMNTNRRIDESSEEEYIERIEKNINGDYEIKDYKRNKTKSNQQFVAEHFSFEIHNILNNDLVFINPFLFQFFDINPFLMEKRNYPIDFGYPATYKYLITIQLPKGYVVHEIPEKTAIALGEDKAITLKFDHQQTPNNIAFSFDLTLNQSYFEATDYKFLQELFKQVINIQKNSLLALKKE